jgi:membrane-bound serine protease (ClpP class)
VVLTLGLLILGFFLLLVETLIQPGFGVAGVAGVLLIVFSVYAATVGIEGDTFWDRVVPDEPAEWTLVEQWSVRFLGSLILAVVGSFALARHLHHLPFLGAAFIRVPVLVPAGAGPSGQGAPGAVTSTGSVKVAVGTEGVCETDLRPAGKARFPQGIVDVVSQGEWIPRGTAVCAALVEGNRVVVVPRGARA